VLRNYPNRFAAGLVRALAFPFGLPYAAPSDALGSAIAELMQTPGESRDRLLADSYVPRVSIDPIGYGELAFALMPRVALLEQRLRQAIRHGRIEPVPQSFADLPEWNEAAQQRGLIDEDERKVLDDYARYGAEVVKVDDFPADFGLLADLQRRKEMLDKAMELAA